METQPGRRVTRAALQGYFPTGNVARRLCPLPEHGCIYVKNANAGSSTVVLWLHRIHTGDHGFLPELNIHKENRLPTTEEVGWRQVARMLRGDAFRFSFVRDPVRRLESAYKDKIVAVRSDRFRVRVQDALGISADPGQPPTFDQFVASLEMQEPIRMDPHWRPQHLNLMHGLVEYDLVGRLENFAADLARVRELAGLPEVPIEVRNAAVRPSDGLCDGRPELLRRVREIYAKDLELYGY
jgi:hypothetical protein